MQMQHAEFGRLAEHVEPDLGRKLLVRLVQLERIGAIDAGERAAMRDLCEHCHRRRDRDRFSRTGARQADIIHRATISNRPRPTNSSAKLVMSFKISSLGAPYSAANLSAI